MKKVIPERGDIVTIDLDPVRGHEQKGFRPALVISYGEFNSKTGLALVCPITSKVRGHAFEVVVVAKNTSGVILANQVRTIDIKARRVSVCDRTDDFSLQEVIRKIKLIIE